MHELDVRVGSIHVVEEFFQLLFCTPGDHNDVINKAFVEEWFIFALCKMFFLSC